MPRFNDWSRRAVLKAAAYLAPLGLSRLARAALTDEPAPADAHGAPGSSSGVLPFPLEAIRLKPSIYLTAVESNGSYLLRLEPDRLLHNFRASAGLMPKAAVYGGWESLSLAGHSLGHYLSACSLMFAQAGEARFRERVDYIVTELVQCQSAHGDGYVGGFTRKRDDTVEDGKAIFPEILRGDIRSAPFSLNGAWSPLYTLHKLFAGLLDADRYCHTAAALTVARGLGRYLEKVFSALSESQMQQVLACEYGGLNESFAQLYERTSEAHWLQLARRIYDHKILDPLAAGRDELEGVHSNTQVPKLVGLARLHESTGEAAYRTGARFFWETVTRNRSYVIGGNADRESFQSPLSKFITEQTCEACNTYNMLKLTRHLYQWQPDAAYFDYYERAHLNHILAQHNPATGMFAYMMPLMAGARRDFSSPFDDFWCCMGTGMESHSKHGDSIYWRRGDELFVNLYIPSELTWQDQGATLSMRTEYPFAGDVLLEVTHLERPRELTLSFRRPAWSESSELTVNGRPIPVAAPSGGPIATPHPTAKDSAGGRAGYVTVRRHWKAGDRVELKLGMRLRAEPMRDDPSVVALMQGPMVMAADLGPASDPFTGSAPAIVAPAATPANLELTPFFSQYERRSAVYFPRLTEQQWHAEQAAAIAERTRLAELDAQSIDVMHFGNEQSERDHQLQAQGSEAVLYRGRHGRLARAGTSFDFRMKITSESLQGQPLALQAVYWGRQRNSRFRILADGVAIGTESMEAEGPIAFIERSYPLPAAVTRGKDFIVIRFEPEGDAGAGPVFGSRVLPSV